MLFITEEFLQEILSFKVFLRKKRCDMASDKEYVNFVLDQLSELSDVTCRAMMGEYLLYYRDKVIGGIYNNRFLVKPVPSALSLMPGASFEEPYSGAKDMLLVDNIDDRDFLLKLFNAMYDELPYTKKRNKKIK